MSGLATHANSFVDSGRWHAQAETLVRASGLPFVFLHPLFFASIGRSRSNRE